MRSLWHFLDAMRHLHEALQKFLCVLHGQPFLKKCNDDLSCADLESAFCPQDVMVPVGVRQELLSREDKVVFGIPRNNVQRSFPII